MVVHNRLRLCSSFLLGSSSSQHPLDGGGSVRPSVIYPGGNAGECLCSFVLLKHAYRSLLMSADNRGEERGGEGEEIREEQIDDSRHERDGDPSEGSCRVRTPRRRATERGLAGDVGGSVLAAVSEAGGGRCGTCWETRLLHRWDGLIECEGKVSTQVACKT